MNKNIISFFFLCSLLSSSYISASESYKTMHSDTSNDQKLSHDSLKKELKELNEKWEPTMKILSIDASIIMGFAEEYCRQRNNILDSYKVKDSIELVCPSWHCPLDEAFIDRVLNSKK